MNSRNVANENIILGEIDIVLSQKRFPKKAHLHMSIVLGPSSHLLIIFMDELCCSELDELN